MVPMREITRWKSAGCLKSGFTVALILGCSCIASAQDPEANSAGKAPVPAVTSLNLMGPPDLKSLPRNLFQDQKSFWLTPFHMNKREWRWTIPLAFVGAGMLASDTAIEKHVPTDPSTVSHATTASNAGLALLLVRAPECFCGGTSPTTTIAAKRGCWRAKQPLTQRWKLKSSNMQPGGNDPLKATAGDGFFKAAPPSHRCMRL